MTWTSAESELRSLLSDNDTDRLRFQKRVFGQIDGTNKDFKTFEFRRITNFVTSSIGSLGVFVNNVKVTVSTDEVSTGFFQLASAPVPGDLVVASYYIQYFTLPEIQTFLTAACKWLGYGAIYANIQDGLQPSALKYAAHEAYQKLALRMSESLSSTFRLEDVPDAQVESAIKTYQDLSAQFMSEAITLRNDFYGRQGKQLSPLHATLRGSVKEVMPRR